MAEAVDLGKVLRERERGEFLVKVGNDFVNRGWELQEKRMVDELDEIVERQLEKVFRPWRKI